MTRTTVVTAVVLSVACLCSTAAAAPSSHFPLRDGATWKLTDENGLALTVRASRSGQAYILRGLPGLTTVRVRRSGADVQAWDSRVDGWRPFLRLGARAGTATSSTCPARRSGALDVKVASRSATCSDASGRGRSAAAWCSSSRAASRGRRRHRAARLRAGIGLAEVVVQTIAGSRSYTLGGKAPLS